MNISVDIETLGATTNAPIIQIGAVKFLDDGTIVDTFNKHVDFSSIDPDKFRIDPTTVAWWMSNDKVVQDKVFGSQERIPLSSLMLDYLAWLGADKDKATYWGHASFDFPVIRNNFIKCGLEDTVPFRNICDLRSLRRVLGEVEVERIGSHHDALDDAMHQAKIVVAYLERVVVIGRLSMGEDGIIGFGKHKGKLYSEAWAEDEPYMRWLHAGSLKEGGFKLSEHFQKWLDKKINTHE